LADITLANFQNQPHVSIAIADHQKHYDITFSTPFKVYDLKGDLIHYEERSKTYWRFKFIPYEKNKKQEIVLIAKSHIKSDLKKLADELALDSFDILTIGGEVFYNNELLHDNTTYHLISENIENYHRIKHDSNIVRPKIVEKLSKTTGEIRMFDAEFTKEFTDLKNLKIIPDDFSKDIFINNVEYYDSELKKYYTKNLYVNGVLYLVPNGNAKLDLLNFIPTENYIYNVIHSEVGEGVSKEFYKAMAVVVRCEIINRVGHRYLGENYDFHANEDRLLFFPKKFENKEIQAAIQETKYEVMYYGSEVCQAFISISCGGVCDEGNEVLRTSRPINYNGKLDCEENNDFDFSSEDSFKKWLKSSPESNCNIENLSKFPKQLKIGKKYFRWEEYFSISQIEKNLVKYGEDIGQLVDIMIDKRTKAGRITELELIGTHKNRKIYGEDKIRKILSSAKLPSAAFWIEKDFSDDGFLAGITVLGAGHGHGVGLCKTGATVMGENGKSYREILEHYYFGAKIEAIIK
jgi:SpoIID/LytB domain protein